jgi:hypothetical protein
MFTIEKNQQILTSLGTIFSVNLVDRSNDYWDIMMVVFCTQLFITDHAVASVASIFQALVLQCHNLFFVALFPRDN